MDAAPQRADAEGALMAVFLQGLADPAFGDAGALPQGPLLSLDDWAALARAPRRAAGTQVSVRATPVRALAGIPDHMFVHFDDGTTQLIARGGPSEENGGYLRDSNRVAAEVTPAASSRDRDASYGTIASKFLPGVNADQAAAYARAHALGVDNFANRYGPDYNSNSYAADVAEPIFGYRPNDGRTWGYRERLLDGPPPATYGSAFTGPLRPGDLTPVIRNPPY
jgi:hypothetical protein